MSKLITSIVIGAIVAIIVTKLFPYVFKLVFVSNTLPDLEVDEWWGPDDVKRDVNDTSIRPFQVHFSEEMIKDLKYRLEHYRRFPSLDGTLFEYGFNSEVLDTWIAYWTKEYDFKRAEDTLNKYPQFKTEVQGLDIHFIRVIPQVKPNTTIIPLLIMHGWPSSVTEFYDVLPLLTSPSDNRDFQVEVVVPSLPGYGFSDASTKPGLGAVKMAVVFRNLMHRLGHRRFYVQGGDWGALIGRHMATLFPKEVLGYHTNFPIFITPFALISEALGSIYPSFIADWRLTSRMYPLINTLIWTLEELGYCLTFTNKPDTFSIALADSPSGLLTTILQKFSMATKKSYRKDPEGGLGVFTKDQLLDNVMVYWVTNTIASSIRMYAESFNMDSLKLRLDSYPSDVPTWAILAKNDVHTQPPSIIRFKHTLLLHTTILDEGGHFLALQLPQVFAEDVLKALTEFRKYHVWLRVTNGKANDEL